MKSSRFRYTVIYVAVIGLFLSFALCRGDKAEVDYFDFAEIVTYNTDRDHRSDETRYTNIGLSEEKRNEIQNIFSNFDSSVFFENNFDFYSWISWKGSCENKYWIIIKIKNKPYLIKIVYCEDVEDTYFWLQKIDKFDGKFYYREGEVVSEFKNRELSKRLDEFIRGNKNLIDGKMNNIKQEQPKYASPMIQRIHERYCETADGIEDWVYDIYYDFIAP